MLPPPPHTQAVFEIIDGFVALFEKNRYAHTATVGARHVMTALYLFLDMNELNYCPDIAYIWYNKIIPITGVCYRTWRRIVILFGCYTHEGDISFNKKYNLSPGRMNQYTDWCKSAVDKYLEWLRKSFHSENTVRAYEYSV